MIKRLGSRDTREWKEVLKKLPAVDCYGMPELAGLWETAYPYNFEAVYAEFGDNIIFYPYIVRPLAELPFGKRISEEIGECYDITSPEYGGIFHNFPEDVPYEVCSQFSKEFGSYCQERKIVTEFGRVQVLLSNTTLGPGYNVRRLGRVVIADLRGTEEDILNNMSKEGRKKLRQAERVPITVRDMGSDGFHKFPPLYYQTMDYHDAMDRYYFPEGFFENMIYLPDEFCFILGAYTGDKLTAAIIILYGGGVGYSYLSATDREFQELRPNNILFYQMLIECKRRGCHTFVLGGGAHGEDGTFKFKQNFSELTAEFFIYDRLHMPDVYQKLIELKTEYEHNLGHKNFDPLAVEFFPIYRAAVRSDDDED